MSLSPETIDALIGAGATAEMLGAAIKAEYAADAAKEETRKAKARAKKRSQRASKSPSVPACPGDSEGQPGTVRDGEGQFQDKGFLPDPLPKTQPSSGDKSPSEITTHTRARARDDLKRMMAEAREAAGDALASAATTPGIAMLTPLITLLNGDPPCFWTEDVLPAIGGAAAWHRSRDGPGSMRSWTTAVRMAVQNRDRRIAGVPEPRAHHDQPSRSTAAVRSEDRLLRAFVGAQVAAESGGEGEFD